MVVILHVHNVIPLGKVTSVATVDLKEDTLSAMDNTTPACERHSLEQTHLLVDQFSSTQPTNVLTPPLNPKAPPFLLLHLHVHAIFVPMAGGQC